MIGVVVFAVAAAGLFVCFAVFLLFSFLFFCFLFSCFLALLFFCFILFSCVFFCFPLFSCVFLCFSFVFLFSFRVRGLLG